MKKLFLFCLSLFLLLAFGCKQRDIKSAARYYCERHDAYSGGKLDTLEAQKARYYESLSEDEKQIWEETCKAYSDSVNNALIGIVSSETASEPHQEESDDIGDE